MFNVHDLKVVVTELRVVVTTDKQVSDMGCHIDGFIAVIAHTHVLLDGPVMGRQVDVIAAANPAAEVALRYLNQAVGGI
ncbi:hypothetical protein IFM89_011806 [Coptis chinensis]|uniref:Uncharacterized protein n=1 Tax=Coptis chinensis TaxID=261450 RepID=A0A835H3Q5_9MAGN|nr:hypothetical protein IFM89_011806 [Coptis chinensis]